MKTDPHGQLDLMLLSVLGAGPAHGYRVIERLRVHGRRRRRVLEEVSGHLHECAAGHGEAEAVRRMGDPGAVARSFTPRPFDRAFEQRDRLAALVMLAAMAASVPLAWTLQRL